MKKNNETTITTKEMSNLFDVLYNIFCEVCTKIIINFFKILYSGLILIWNKRSKEIFLLTTVIISSSVSLYFNYIGTNKVYLSIVPVLIYFFVAGIIYKIINIKIGVSQKIFEKINFKDKSGNYPKILRIQKNKKDKRRQIVICKSYIPFSKWIDNRDSLEIAFNSKIKIIKSNHKQVIKLILLKGVGKSGL